MIFGQELIVLASFRSMLVVWRFKQRTFYIDTLRVKLILACQEVLKMSLTLNELKQVALHSISNTTSEYAPQVERNVFNSV